jgi:6-phosphogluconolactonase
VRHVKTTPHQVLHLTLAGLLLTALAACGGGGSSGTAMVTCCTVGGMVIGLIGWGLVLQNNGGDDLAVSATGAGAFTFTAPLANGAAYAVTVKTQPSSPAQNRVGLSNGSGTVDAANVTDVTVQCENVGRFAYVANAGGNTVSAYSIDSMTGALSAVGTAVATGLSPCAR